MRALTVVPGKANTISLDDVASPPESEGAVLVRALALGICGTDREIIAGEYGWPPPGAQKLTLGHESLGQVEQAPAGAGVKPGDLVVGIVCLTGVSSGGHTLKFDVGQMNRGMVLENDVVFGSVNADRRHYRAAAEALAKADKDWLARLITRRVPLARWQEAFERRPDDIKVVLDFAA